MNNSVYLNLNKDINAQYLLNQIQRMIHKSNRDDPDSSKVLKISIQKISSTTNELVPKLEYKNEQ